MLNILICTINKGIDAIEGMLLNQRSDVRYIVSWQQTGTMRNIPEILQQREDVVVDVIEGRGLCRNRNNALRIASLLSRASSSALKDHILSFADDDEQLCEEGINALLDYYKKHEDVDGVLTKLRTHDGGFIKSYPTEGFKYIETNDLYYPSSVEFSFRLSALIQCNLRFDERFGLGSTSMACGEEEVFLHDAVNKDLNIRWEPIIVASTNAQTTGGLFLTDKAVQRSKGGVMCYTKGAMVARLLCIKEALYYTVHQGRNPFPLILEMWRGISLINKSKKK